MARALENWLDAIWYGGRVERAWLLSPLAAIFRLLTALRRAAYRAHWLRAPQLPVPVIVAGNITVGGTGKTPLVLWLVNALREDGWRPGVVSRGYGSSAGRGPAMVHADSEAVAVGDEPLMIARRTGCPVAVGADRVGCVRAVHAAGANIVVSDDGLQHLRLARSVELVVIDGVRGLGNGRMLPAGPLREPATRLDSVDAVVVNGGVARRPGNFRMRVEPAGATRLHDGATRELAEFAGKKVHALAGIGNPERFFARLRDEGLDVIAHPLSDHAPLSADTLMFDDLLPVFMTEKDAVKCASLAHDRCWYVPAVARFDADDDARLRDLLRSRVGRPENGEMR